MIRYGELLKKIRLSKKLTQLEMAKSHNMSNYSYSSIERGRVGHTAKTVKSFLNSDMYTSKEKEDLNKVYSNIVNEHKEQKRKESLFLKNRKKCRQNRNEDMLIRNNPEFYKKLNSLGDLSKVDINDSKLQDVRELVSGKRYWKGEDY